MKKNKKYDNLHQYLDEVFLDVNNPSKEQIAQAKKEYWKLWYREYHRERRKKRKEFTLGFDQKTLLLINSKKGTMTISKFLYSAVEHYLTGATPVLQNKEQLTLLHQESMHLISNLEAIIDTESYEALEQVIEKLEHLEQNFSKLY